MIFVIKKILGLSYLVVRTVSGNKELGSYLERLGVGISHRALLVLYKALVLHNT